MHSLASNFQVSYSHHSEEQDWFPNLHSVIKTGSMSLSESFNPFYYSLITGTPPTDPKLVWKSQYFRPQNGDVCCKIISLPFTIQITVLHQPRVCSPLLLILTNALLPFDAKISPFFVKHIGSKPQTSSHYAQMMWTWIVQCMWQWNL